MLGIHIDLRNMLVSGPNAIVAIETGSSLGAALSGATRKNGRCSWHMTFVGLLRRDVLSVPFALNEFIWANFYDSARLWSRAEVQAFVGLLPTIVSNWTRDWCPSIVATDASEYGFGVCLKECKKSVWENIGRTSERARKCHPDSPGARTTFFDQHDDATSEMMLAY